MTAFHKEPAQILAFFAAVVALGSQFLLHWSDDQQALVNAVAVAVAGLVTAWSVKGRALSAAIMGLVSAILALGLGFGWHLSGSAQAVIMSFVAAAVGMFVSTQVTTRDDVVA